MRKRLHVLFLLLAASGLLAAGCGGEDDTPDTEGEARQECLERAGKIKDAGARKAAEEACRGKADKARDAAAEQCLETAKSIPDSDQRKQAEDVCRATPQ